MSTPRASYVITGPDAAALAGITYRQLDYWARQGWLQPSLDRGRGRAARRKYSAEDVVRLAALAHLGRSKADMGALGPQLGRLDIPHGDVLVVVGPGSEVAAVAGPDLRRHVSSGGAFRVFDPTEIRAALQRTTEEAPAPAGVRPQRRSA